MCSYLSWCWCWRDQERTRTVVRCLTCTGSLCPMPWSIWRRSQTARLLEGAPSEEPSQGETIKVIWSHNLHTLFVSYLLVNSVTQTNVSKPSPVLCFSWSETFRSPSFSLLFFPSSSEELFPREQQRARQSSLVQPAGQRLLQQAAVDHLSAPSHRPVTRQDSPHQPVTVVSSPRSRPVSHSRAQPQLGHRNGRPHQSLTVSLSGTCTLTVCEWWMCLDIFSDINVLFIIFSCLQLQWLLYKVRTVLNVNWPKKKMCFWVCIINKLTRKRLLRHSWESTQRQV